MLNTKKSLIIGASIFVFLQIILAVLIQYATGKNYSYLCIVCIGLALLFTILRYRKNKVCILMLIAMVFTLLADIILSELFTFNKLETLSVSLFFVTQTCYFIRLFINQTKKERTIHIIIRVSLSIVGIVATFIVLRENANFLAVLSVFYYANLLVNIAYSFIKFKQNKLFALGLLCFGLCDLFVGLKVLESSFMIITEGSFIYEFTHLLNWAWLFYVPAQTLLPLSIPVKQ